MYPYIVIFITITAVLTICPVLYFWNHCSASEVHIAIMQYTYDTNALHPMSLLLLREKEFMLEVGIFFFFCKYSHIDVY